MYGSATIMGTFHQSTLIILLSFSIHILFHGSNPCLPSIFLVLTVGDGVHGFTLDPSSGEFVYTHPQITIPKKKNIYSVNEGYAKYWLDPVTEYVNKIKNPANDKEIYSARYVGR